MKEKDFSIRNAHLNVQIDGGRLWQAPDCKAEEPRLNLDAEKQKLSIYLYPNDPFSIVQDHLFELVREKNIFYYLVLQLKKRVPSLLLLIPIALTVVFIGFITVWGDLVINWVFLGKNDPTVFGIPMNQSAVLYALIAILVIYFFPVLFTGEQDGFIEALNERFSNREQLRKRLFALVAFLHDKGDITTVEIWNPDLSNEQYDWVAKSLLPALLEVSVEIILHVRIDERPLVENYFQQQSAKTLIWDDQPMGAQGIGKSIAYDYLESWERRLLAVYVFASTASLPEHWRTLTGSINDGVLNNVVSLRLVKVLIERFKERLFMEDDLNQLISLDLFASRCLNDYGILSPSLHYTSDVWQIDLAVVNKERVAIEEEMKFMSSYLKTDIGELVQVLEDPIAALKLASVQENESIYNEHRLLSIRFFVQVIYSSEQYKILKQYWALVIGNTTSTEDLNEDVYRIIGVDLLLQLATIFERAAMYQHAYAALNYIERIFPFRGIVGKARVKERQGNFEASVVDMLQILEDFQKGNIHLKDSSNIDLNLNISWAIVSGRLEKYRAIGRECIEAAEALLYNKFDTVRDNDQTIRLYNILANYEEWEGRPIGAIENYDKALQIPGVSQSGLSNLLVNKGIALRQMKRLEEGAFYGKQGVDIKVAIGDADQLPIAQHNLAQTCLELAFSTQDQTQQEHYLKEAEYQAKQGLDIQKQTGSIKKRGQLLTEYFISRFELTKMEGLPIVDCQEPLQAVQDWLKAELEAGRGQTYDCRVVVGELLGTLVEFEGNSLQEAINWRL